MKKNLIILLGSFAFIQSSYAGYGYCQAFKSSHNGGTYYFSAVFYTRELTDDDMVEEGYRFADSLDAGFNKCFREDTRREARANLDDRYHDFKQMYDVRKTRWKP